MSGYAPLNPPEGQPPQHSSPVQPAYNPHVGQPVPQQGYYAQPVYQQPPMGMPVAQQPYYVPGQPQPAYVVQVAGVPNYGQPGHIPRGMWSDTLCDCFDSFGICLLSWCVSPFQWAQNMERVNFYPFMTGLMMYGIPWLLVWIMEFIFDFTMLWYFAIPAVICNFIMIYLGMVNRTKLRHHYQIPGGECEDCLVHAFCRCCAVAQEARHISRDLAIPI